MNEKPTQSDLEAIKNQLGRTPRDVHAVSYRCPCGKPAVVTTPPRLSDGTPFPTFYYATCPKLTGAISTLETTGMMADMQVRLTTDPALAESYKSAHLAYIAARDEVATEVGIVVEEVSGITAGGMPDRVKCLHSLVAHSLSVGPGVNPLGDEALAALPQWWLGESCSDDSPGGS